MLRFYGRKTVGAVRKHRPTRSTNAVEPAVSMEMTAWNSLYHAMHASDDRRPFSKATLLRILAFARPHRRQLISFLVLSVAAAVLAVATPVLAGRVVDAIVDHQAVGIV